MLPVSTRNVAEAEQGNWPALEAAIQAKVRRHEKWSLIANEIIQHLASLPNSEVIVTLEIQARVPGGVPDNVVRTVSENCCTLKFGTQAFEKD